MTNERERIRRELVADPRVVEAVVDAVHERVPAYADLDDGRRGEVRAIAAWALERFLHLWTVDGDIGPADLRRFRGIAAARAADGRPLPAVLRAYRVAATVLVDEIAARAAPSAAADAFALTRRLLTTLDTLCEVMAGSYTATSERLAGDRAQALRLLLDDLIAGRHASVGAVTDRAARLGVELPYPYCLLVVVPREDEDPADPAELLAVLTGPAAGTPLATAQGSRTVLLLPADAAPAAPGCCGNAVCAAARSPARAWTASPSPTASPPAPSPPRRSTPTVPGGSSPTPTRTCWRCSPGTRPRTRSTSAAWSSARSPGPPSGTCWRR
ncbi:hypothetical protein ACQEVS_32025 [Streptomyces sp. CA-181903]|uniref:hypothetical protein n=1 Tax=Streptomyces sp. CA-181903 TaxID=3240055 RepID=UPI003D8A80F5